MKSKNRVLILLGVSLLAVLLLSSASIAAISFGLDAAATKIGDSNDYPTYGLGHSIAIVNGSQVYAVYPYDNWSGEGEITLSYSKDGGLTWERGEVLAHNPYILSGTGAAIAVGPDPAIPGNKLVHVVWGEYNGSGGIYYSNVSVRPDGSWNWPPRTPIKVSGLESAQTHARAIAADGIGGVHIAYKGGYGTYYSYSPDGGVNFTEIGTIISTQNGEPSITADSIGNAYVAYQYGSVYFSKRPAGGSWSLPIAVNGAYSANYPSIGAYDSNKIYITWGAGTSGIILASTTTGGGEGTWGQNVVDSQPGADTSLAVDSAGVLNIVWERYNNQIYFARNLNNSVSRWTAPVLVYSGDSNPFPDITTDSSGKVYLVYSRSYTIFFTKEK